MFGGAKGGGKSKALFWDAVMRCLFHDEQRIPVHAGIFRRHIKELKENHMLWARNLPKAFGTWRASDKEFWFPHGARLSFYHIEVEDDVKNFQSAEWEFVYPDEATLFTPYQLEFLYGQWRTSLPVRKRLRLASNPGGPGHEWVKERFVDPDPDGGGEPWYDPETHTTRAYIKTTWRDNEYLEDDYEFSSLQSIPEGLREAFKEGNWDLHVDRFFTTWSSRKHVIAPFEVPRSYRRWGSVDWGYTAPLHAQAWARDSQGHHFVYRTLHQARLSNEMQAELMAKMFPEVHAWVADPAIWNPTGYSRGKLNIVAHDWMETWRKMGHHVVLLPGNNDRGTGWQRIQDMLKDDEEGVPWLQVFNTCRELIASFPRAQTNPTGKKRGDKHPGEDIAPMMGDDPLDATRYGALYGYRPTTKPVSVGFLRR